MATKYVKWPQNMPNGLKNLPNGHKIYQHLPLQDTPKFTQIFGLKINHLANLIPTETLIFLLPRNAFNRKLAN
jgi:hypothetical protein